MCYGLRLQDLRFDPKFTVAHLVTGRQSFGQNNTRVAIAIEFRVRYQDSSDNNREPWDPRAVIEVLYYELHQIFPTSELAQVVECSEDLEFLQQSGGGDTPMPSMRMNKE
jgi:hypothetical protein